MHHSSAASCHWLDTAFFRALLGGKLFGRQLPTAPVPPPTVAELWRALRSGSDACAMDGLPRQLLAALPRHALQLLLSLAYPAGAAADSDLLWTVLLLPLRKKEPHWLLRNSRPILLEPPLLRAVATVHFRRLMAALEEDSIIPDEMLAYRRGMSVVHAAILIRWLLCWWTAAHDVWPGDAAHISTPPNPCPEPPPSYFCYLLLKGKKIINTAPPHCDLLAA